MKKKIPLPDSPCPEPVEGRGGDTTRSGVGWSAAKIFAPPKITHLEQEMGGCHRATLIMIAMDPPPRWGDTRPTAWACTTCPATSGNGSRTSSLAMATLAPTTRYMSVLALAAFFGAAAGATFRAACGVPIAATAARLAGTTAWGFAFAGVGKFSRKDPTPSAYPPKISGQAPSPPRARRGGKALRFLRFNRKTSPFPPAWGRGLNRTRDRYNLKRIVLLRNFFLKKPW